MLLGEHNVEIVNEVEMKEEGPKGYQRGYVAGFCGQHSPPRAQFSSHSRRQA